MRGAKIPMTPSRMARRFLPLLLSAVCLAISGCGRAGSSSSTGTSRPQTAIDHAEPVNVVLALNWFPEAEHGGFYAALVHGYYAEEGLKVTIRPGGPKVPVVADAASGTVDFAVDNADKLILARVQQADVVAVMAPIQNSPRCIMVHKTSGLKRLEDLKDKRPFTLAMNAGQPYAQFLKKRVDLTDIQVVAYPGNVSQFIEASDFGQQAYNFSEPFLAEQKGSDPQCLMLSDLGFNTYTSMLITRREMLDTRSDLVRKMVRASIRGWQKYLTDPKTTNEYIHAENAEMPLDVLEFGVNALKPLCLPEGFTEDRLGEMTPERWKTLTEQLIEIGSIGAGTVAPESAFTTRFVSPDANQ